MGLGGVCGCCGDGVAIVRRRGGGAAGDRVTVVVEAAGAAGCGGGEAAAGGVARAVPVGRAVGLVDVKSCVREALGLRV